MKIIRSALKSANAVLSHQFESNHAVRAFSASAFPIHEVYEDLKPSDSLGESEHGNSNDKNASFFKKLGKIERAHDDVHGMAGVLRDSYNTLSDGMDFKLKKAAAYFEFDPLEVAREDYTFRPDVNFQSGMSYDTKDLDLRKPGVHRPTKRLGFDTTTAEVLQKADFRNVKFLANFITEAGIIQKRSKMGISAKAQRKVAREIKTARAFGLMPFTSMGTKQFKYGFTMEDMDRDFEFESSTYEHNFVEEDAGDA